MSPAAPSRRDHADPPLPPCPDTPNCVRTSRAYAASPGSVYRAAQTALEPLQPSRLQLVPAERRAEAVYRVGFVFKDDVDVVVTPAEPGSVLHVRSASRVGSWDFGVNRRRVNRFFDALDRTLDE